LGDFRNAGQIQRLALAKHRSLSIKAAPFSAYLLRAWHDPSRAGADTG